VDDSAWSAASAAVAVAAATAAMSTAALRIEWRWTLLVGDRGAWRASWRRGTVRQSAFSRRRRRRLLLLLPPLRRGAATVIIQATLAALPVTAFDAVGPRRLHTHDGRRPPRISTYDRADGCRSTTQFRFCEIVIDL